MTLVYITCKDEKEAIKISKHLLEKRLIACSNIHPIRSLYWWKGRIQDEKEYVIIAKTTDKNYNKIKKEVSKIHSYDVPCILKINAEANEKYDKWAKGEVR
ncbi:divalent-cation tolerance protein CutA [Candidatus Woesearchaeota archaeon]|nr:divalent-cation tolerance protein CutA [Candidatus Woesearchaeota archaeon]